MGSFLELAELLYRLASSREDTKNVESHGLAEGSALANGNLVALLDTKARGNVSSKVLMPLFISGVLLDEVQVFAADDDSSMHLGRDDGSGQDTASNRYETGEWALLVDVVSLNGSLGGPEAQTNVLVPSPSTLSGPGSLDLDLGVLEDVRLLLESPLGLYSQFGRHCEGSVAPWAGGRMIQRL